MSEVKMRIQIRRGSAADWAVLDPVLLLGEQGLETDSNKVKLGNGVSRWSQLPWHVSFTVGDGLSEDMETGTISVDPVTTDAISASLTQEIADRTAGDAALEVRVDEVEAASLLADNTLQSNLTSESEARSLADTALGVRIDTEISDRTTADGALDSKIGELEQGTNASLVAIQDDVDQNESDADAAIAAVQDDVDQNETDADAAIAAVQADVDQNELDSDEAEAALSGRLDTLEADPVTKVEAYDYAEAQAQDAYDNAIAHADAADGLLSGRLDTLEADPVTKVEAAALAQDAYGNAIAHADAADGLLSGRLDTLEADPVTRFDAYGYADGVLQSVLIEENTSVITGTLKGDVVSALGNTVVDSSLGKFYGSVVDLNGVEVYVQAGAEKVTSVNTKIGDAVLGGSDIATASSGANYVGDAATVDAAVGALDTQAKVNADAIAALVTSTADGSSVATALGLTPKTDAQAAPGELYFDSADDTLKIKA